MKKIKKKNLSEKNKTEKSLDLLQKNQPEISGGQDLINRNTEKDGTLGMRELSIQNVGYNSLPVYDSDLSMDLRTHLQSLRAAQSESMNLLDNTTMHLHGLMHSVATNSNPSNTPPEQATKMLVRNTVDLARELHKSMRLKLDTVKALHKISKDISETEKDKNK